MLCPVSKKYKGIDIAPIIDDNDEYLVNINITIQLIIKIVPNKIFIENKIPRYVATPFPPLNLSQTGNTCPKKAHNEAIYISSGKLILT